MKKKQVLYKYKTRASSLREAKQARLSLYIYIYTYIYI